MVKTPSQHLTIPPLENGDRLNRYEFERRYKAMTYHDQYDAVHEFRQALRSQEE